MRTAFLVVLLLAAAVAAAVFVFGESTDTPRGGDEEPAPLPDAPRPHREDETSATRPPEEPPPKPRPRVAVLEPGEELPSLPRAAVEQAERRSEALRLRVATPELSGSDLLSAASEAYYIRVRDSRDLQVLEQLRMSRRDLGERDELRFGDLLDFWIREGFHVRPEGAFLVFEDERREEREDAGRRPDHPPR